MINMEKSNLVPSQTITYIGALFKLHMGIVLPTQARVNKLEGAVLSLTNGQSSARDYLHLLGLMASCIEIIPNARLHMRPVQLHLLHFWQPITKKMDMLIPFTHHLKGHLKWWLNQANTTQGRLLHQGSTTITITTDASKTGFGGHMSNQIFQGIWSAMEAKQHINILEMEAVIRTVSHFLPQLHNQNVLVRCDNTSVVQYINKQGGTKSVNLCYKTWELFKLIILWEFS